MIEILSNYFKTFDMAASSDGSIDNYVIILTRHLINLWYGHIDDVRNLMLIINQIIDTTPIQDPNPSINDKLLSELDKTFNLHENYYKYLGMYLTPEYNANYLKEFDIISRIKQELSRGTSYVTLQNRYGNLLGKKTFKIQEPVAILSQPLDVKKMNKLKLPINIISYYTKPFKLLLADTPIVELASPDASSSRKYYLLYKKYKTKYLTLREKLSK